jgi:hypothetical protein
VIYAYANKRDSFFDFEIRCFRNSGIAVGFMREAKAELHVLKKVSKSTLSITHSAVASRATKEEEAVTELLGTLTRLNDTVS